MTEQHTSPSRNGEAAALVTDESRNETFARMLATKVAHGYEIESQDGTSAVLVTRGARKWFGLGGRNASAREIVSVDDRGRFTSRKPPA